MPIVDDGVELKAGIAADPGALGDITQQLPRVNQLTGVAVRPALGCEFLACDGCFHELIGDANAEIGVLEEHRIICAARDVEAAFIALLDECPCLLLFGALGVDEFLDVGMLGVEDLHLCRAAGLSTALNRAGPGIEAAHE